MWLLPPWLQGLVQVLSSQWSQAGPALGTADAAPPHPLLHFVSSALKTLEHMFHGLISFVICLFCWDRSSSRGSPFCSAPIYPCDLEQYVVGIGAQ